MKVGGDLGGARKQAEKAWEKDRFSPEAKDPANEFLFPGLGTMSALERSSFPDYARRLWGPIPPAAGGEVGMTGAGPYDPYAPIPAGRTVIEASAGTGKTFTIAAVVTRLVAEEGLPLERILVVTFTRAATAELKDRVRRRMVTTLGALRGVQAGGAADDHISVLLDADRDRQRQYADRLEEALTHFDRAQIFTIHGFALRLLEKLGFRSRLSGDMEPREMDELLLRRAASDLVVGRFAAPRPDDRFEQVTQEHLTQIGKVVVTVPDARITPAPVSVDGLARGPGGDGPGR